MLQTLKKVEAIAMGLGAAMSLTTMVIWGLDMAVGVFVGALIALANFHVMRVLMGKLMLDERSEGSRVALAVMGGLKLFLLIGVVGVAISVLKVNAWGFFVGTLTLVVAIVAAVMLSGFPTSSEPAQES